MIAALTGPDRQKFIYVPGGLDQHQNLNLLFKVLATLAGADDGLKFVVQGSWSDLPISKRHDWQEKFKTNAASSRTLFTGEVHASVEALLCRSSAVVLLATLDASKLKFWKHSRRALQAGSPIVLADAQAKADELNWIEGDLALIGTDSSEIISACLSYLNDENLRNKAHEHSFELADRQVTDHPANHLTRLYSVLLSKTLAT